MKWLNSAIAMMALLLVFLCYTAAEPRAGAQTGLTCLSLTNCCGAAGCEGPGTPSGCSIECAGGGSVVCCSNAKGKCVCGPRGT